MHEHVYDHPCGKAGKIDQASTALREHCAKYISTLYNTERAPLTYCCLCVQEPILLYSVLNPQSVKGHC